MKKTEYVKASVTLFLAFLIAACSEGLADLILGGF